MISNKNIVAVSSVVATGVSAIRIQGKPEIEILKQKLNEKGVTAKQTLSEFKGFQRDIKSSNKKNMLENLSKKQHMLEKFGYWNGNGGYWDFKTDLVVLQFEDLVKKNRLREAAELLDSENMEKRLRKTKYQQLKQQLEQERLRQEELRQEQERLRQEKLRQQKELEEQRNAVTKIQAHFRGNKDRDLVKNKRIQKFQALLYDGNIEKAKEQLDDMERKFGTYPKLRKQLMIEKIVLSEGRSVKEGERREQLGRKTLKRLKSIWRIEELRVWMQSNPNCTLIDANDDETNKKWAPKEWTKAMMKQIIVLQEKLNVPKATEKALKKLKYRQLEDKLGKLVVDEWQQSQFKNFVDHESDVFSDYTDSLSSV